MRKALYEDPYNWVGTYYQFGKVTSFFEGAFLSSAVIHGVGVWMKGMVYRYLLIENRDYLGHVTDHQSNKQQHTPCNVLLFQGEGCQFISKELK